MIAYPMLEDWIFSHGYSIRSFSTAIEISNGAMVRILNGNANPNKETIDKILNKTKLSYEVAFSETVIRKK